MLRLAVGSTLLLGVCTGSCTSSGGELGRGGAGRRTSSSSVHCFLLRACCMFQVIILNVSSVPVFAPFPERKCNVLMNVLPCIHTSLKLIRSDTSLSEHIRGHTFFFKTRQRLTSINPGRVRGEDQKWLDEKDIDQYIRIIHCGLDAEQERKAEAEMRLETTEGSKNVRRHCVWLRTL